MSSQQQRLDGTKPPADHLATTSPNTRNGNLGATKPNEWYCTECGNRITVSPDGQREYGHARHSDAGSGKERCSHWIGNKRGDDA